MITKEELANFSVEQIVVKIAELRKQVSEFKVSQGLKSLEKPHLKKLTKQTIALLNSELNRRKKA